jgi:hypothetical protein
MLIIKPIQDKNFQKEMCALCGFTFDPLQFAYSAENDGELIASCQFDILGKESEISEFGMVVGKDEDLEALIILGRAVLNFLELSGAERCTYTAKETRLAKAIGFKEIEGKYNIELKGLFDGKCAGKCK